MISRRNWAKATEGKQCSLNAFSGPLRSSLRPLVAKGTLGVCGGVKEIGVGFQQLSLAGSQAHKGDRVRSVASGHAILGPYTSAVLEFVGGGSVSVLRMRDLTEA